MPFWPFRRSEPERLTPEELLDRLVEAAATGSTHTLLKACRRYKSQVADHVDFLCRLPDRLMSDEAAANRHIQCVAAAAQCLDQRCGAPELWSRLCGTPDDNPVLRWERWYTEMPARVERLEFGELIDEADVLVEEVRGFGGPGARQQEAIVLGRLGELRFHSGHAHEARERFHEALDLCREIGDVEGRLTYLSNLVEVHRYLGEPATAVAHGEELLEEMRSVGMETGSVEKQVALMRSGEPKCRVVCVQDDREFEVDEITTLPAGHYVFLFRRNRPTLRKCGLLVERGNELAASGDLANAMVWYQEAMEVDPHDPDPVYQSGICLLELGAYAGAGAAFDEVERLAPGWFRVRSDRWLAASLEAGEVSDDEFRVLRALEDGGLPPDQALSMALQAVDRFPEFAPLQLVLGDCHHKTGNATLAEACYRRGLELVADPDLESRLLCALGVVLPASLERTDVLQRASLLEGSLVATATARLMQLL